MITRRSLGALSLGAALPLPALAQGLSNRPIRLVIPFTPAGTTDLVGRLTAERLSARLGQQVVVDNRPGASGNVGGEFVARSEPDGHTLLLTTIGTGAINFAVFGNRMPFKPEDLAAVGLMCRVPNVLMAANRMPIRTLADMTREAKAKPGGLNYGTAGIATSPHVVIEQIRLAQGIQITHVPFRGSAPMLTEMVAERIELGMDNIPSALTFIRDGKIRAIGVTGAQRSAVLPDVPTIAETLPGFEVALWNGYMAPANTPAPILNRIAAEIRAVMRTDDMKAKLAQQGSEPVGSTPEEFRAFVASEIPKWAELVRISGAKVE